MRVTTVMSGIVGRLVFVRRAGARRRGKSEAAALGPH
jgi:hypothetical protein